MADTTADQERIVEIALPKLSDDANHRLTEAVRAVLGTDRVTVPADRPRVSHGEAAKGSLLQRGVSSQTAVAVGTAAVAVCVGLIIALTGNSWWLTALAFVVLAIAVTFVLASILGLASTLEFPDPTLAALLSEQGVREPDVLFSELVAEFTPQKVDEHLTTAVEDDPARAAAEQQTAVTPAGGTSRAVGPGQDD